MAFQYSVVKLNVNRSHRAVDPGLGQVGYCGGNYDHELSAHVMSTTNAFDKKFIISGGIQNTQRKREYCPMSVVDISLQSITRIQAQFITNVDDNSGQTAHNLERRMFNHLKILGSFNRHVIETMS